MQSCATPADAEPPDEPPGTRPVSSNSGNSIRPTFAWPGGRAATAALRRRHGLITGPKHEVSFDEPIANSSLLSLPSSTAPSRHRCEVTVDSYGGLNSPRIFEQAVVRTSLVANRSLIPSGMPPSGPPS